MPHKDPDARRAYERAYYKTHPEKRRTKATKHRVKFPERHRAYTRKDHKKHHAKRLEDKRQDRRAHPEKAKAAERRYRHAHPERIRATEKKYKLTHPGVDGSKAATRRARLKGATINDFSRAQWLEMKDHYGHSCVYCGRIMLSLTQDHITPLSKGGAHTLWNIVPACVRCNSMKCNGAIPLPVQPLLLTIASKKTR